MPSVLTEALESLEITHQVRGRSGFQLVFQTGRNLEQGLGDDVVLRSDALTPFSRVILVTTLNAAPHVLLDGIITRQEFAPSEEPGESRLTITGEDVSVMMDLEEKSVEHRELDDSTIVETILLKYAKYGLVPKVMKPSVIDRPLPTERTPVQLGTDLGHIQELADRYGFLFYITPGPITGQNTAYWGPPQAKGQPHKPLRFNMGGESNVESINVQYDALAATFVEGMVQDRKTNLTQPISKKNSSRSPLARKPAIRHQSHLRTTQFRQSDHLSTVANAYAQAMLDRSTDSVVTVTGQLNTLIYGDVLQAGRVVELKGVGQTYDGKFYVSQVSHVVQASNGENSYKQRFTLIREG
ncbi:hypothetical protein K9N68_12345 [Kovacikia minuta CCNUW1]|uniref:hypothetical protein n=1 Tax=Kovacikia minuta TaxID=2931930 RepID=UPI001CCC7553|nr:hypothetical protein [Kovacikia minuta]UBF28590.1 hypothetical protein K9N68_12345 [Kovacikia minuta CCNUW1]